MGAKMILAIIMGLLFGVATFVIFLFISPDIAFLFSVFSGAFTTLSLHIYFVIYEKIKNIKCSVVEKEIIEPVICKTNGNLYLGEKVKNVNVYFCENEIVFISLERKPCVFKRILKTEIAKFDVDDVCIIIDLKDGNSILISLPYAKTVYAVLQNKNWI